MNAPQKKEVPHHHRCTVVDHLIGCENQNCKVPFYTVCKDEDHVEIYRRATVHMMEADGVLPCCGRKLKETTVGDRMTYIVRDVTCEGIQRPTNATEEDAAEVRARAVHDPFGPEAEQQAHTASMAGPGVE